MRMNLTIYVPDELAEQIRATDINVSATCRAALESELIKMKLAEETERVEFTDQDGNKHFFHGRKIGSLDSYQVSAEVYLTARGSLAVVDHEGSLDVYDNFDAFAEAWGEGAPELVGEVASELDESWAQFHDI